MTNLTDHAVRVFNSNGELVVELPPSGMVARVSVKREQTGTIAGVEVFRTVKGNPFVVRKSDGAFVSPSDVQGNLIVSLAFREAMAGTEISSRLFSPGELKRNAEGQLIGCVGLHQ